MFPYGKSHRLHLVVTASVLGVLLALSEARAQPDASDGVTFDDRYFIDGQVAPTFTRPEVVELFSGSTRWTPRDETEAAADETQRTGSGGSIAFAEPKGPAKVLRDLLKTPVKELLVSRAEAGPDGPPSQGAAAAPPQPGNAPSEPTSVPARAADPLSERPRVAEAPPELPPTAAPPVEPHGQDTGPPQAETVTPSATPDRAVEVAAPPAPPPAGGPVPTPNAPAAPSDATATAPGPAPEAPAVAQNQQPSERPPTAAQVPEVAPPAEHQGASKPAERSALRRPAKQPKTSGEAPPRRAARAMASADASQARTASADPRRERGSGAPTVTSAILPGMSLPGNLAPTDWLQSGSQKRAYVSEMGWLRGEEDVLKTIRQPLPAVPVKSLNAVSACGQAIFGAAQPQGAVRTETTASGPERRREQARTLPVEVRLTYSGWSSSEVRRARVACRLQRSGQVVGLSPL